jgi:hypothetical protein
MEEFHSFVGNGIAFRFGNTMTAAVSEQFAIEGIRG